MSIRLESLAGITVLEHTPSRIHKLGPSWAKWLSGIASVALAITLIIVSCQGAPLEYSLFLIIATELSVEAWIFLTPIHLPDKYLITRDKECSEDDWGQIIAHYNVEHISGSCYVAQLKLERGVRKSL